GGHELAMLGDDGAIGADNDDRVVERAATRVMVPLFDAANDGDLVLSSGLAQRRQIAARHVDRVAEQARVQLRNDRCVGAGTQAPDPHRVAGDEGFREYDELGTGSRCFGDGIRRVANRPVAVEQRGRLLDHRDLAHASPRLWWTSPLVKFTEPGGIYA